MVHILNNKQLFKNNYYWYSLLNFKYLIYLLRFLYNTYYQEKKQMSTKLLGWLTDDIGILIQTHKYESFPIQKKGNCKDQPKLIY